MPQLHVARLAIFAAMFVLITRALVALLPNWTVPLPSLAVAAALALLAGVAWFAASPLTRPPRHAAWAWAQQGR